MALCENCYFCPLSFQRVNDKSYPKHRTQREETTGGEIDAVNLSVSVNDRIKNVKYSRMQDYVQYGHETPGDAYVIGGVSLAEQGAFPL